MIVVVDRALKLLQKHCPLPKPHIIKEISKRKGLGFAYFNGDIFKIEIATDVESITQVETLTHEWAHCLAGGHNDSWGIEYARCYRAVHFNGADRKYNIQYGGMMVVCS